jgi:hypothetical protein
MFKKMKRIVLKMFREFLVYHHDSLEFRAKLLTLMVSSNSKVCECEKKKLKEIAYKIYPKEPERAELMIETVDEYHQKIITNNGLNFEHLIQLVERDVKKVKRFSKKIDIGLLMELHECVKDDAENYIFQTRIIEFLQNLKDEYKDVK